jgi:hypothetical protein
MYLTDKENHFQDELARLLPGLITKSVRAGNEQQVNHCHYCILPQIENFSKSQYYYKRKSLEFIHFSTLEAVRAIISSKLLRLYNLYNLNDPREYSFAGDLFHFNAENRADAKTNMFLLSMCRTDILRGHTQYEFNMWRLYGKSGDGIALQLDFSLNPHHNWKDYYLSEVYYGAASKTNLKELNEILVKFENERPKMTIDLGQIVTFHKSNLYKLEKEVRLLYDNRQKRVHGPTTYSNYREKLSPIIKPDIEKGTSSKKDIQFLELPIFNKSFEQINTQIPIPKIKKIILGHSYIENKQQIVEELRTSCNESLGYDVPIEQSRLAKYYYER